MNIVNCLKMQYIFSKQSLLSVKIPSNVWIITPWVSSKETNYYLASSHQMNPSLSFYRHAHKPDLGSASILGSGFQLCSLVGMVLSPKPFPNFPVTGEAGGKKCERNLNCWNLIWLILSTAHLLKVPKRFPWRLLVWDLSGLGGILFWVASEVLWVPVCV